MQTDKTVPEINFKCISNSVMNAPVNFFISYFMPLFDILTLCKSCFNFAGEIWTGKKVNTSLLRPEARLVDTKHAL